MTLHFYICFAPRPTWPPSLKLSIRKLSVVAPPPGLSTPKLRRFVALPPNASVPKLLYVNSVPFLYSTHISLKRLHSIFVDLSPLSQTGPSPSLRRFCVALPIFYACQLETYTQHFLGLLPFPSTLSIPKLIIVAPPPRLSVPKLRFVAPPSKLPTIKLRCVAPHPTLSIAKRYIRIYLLAMDNVG